MIGLRLFLPDSWTSDAGRMDRAKGSAQACAYRTRPDIALADIGRMRSADVRSGGSSPTLATVCPADVAMIFPVAGRMRPRKNHMPSGPSRLAQEMLGSAKWQTVSWRRSTNGKLSARFAAARVRVF